MITMPIALFVAIVVVLTVWCTWNGYTEGRRAERERRRR